MTQEDISDSDCHFDVAVDTGTRRTSTLIEAPTEWFAYLSVLKSWNALEEKYTDDCIEIYQNDSQWNILGVVTYENGSQEIRDAEREGVLLRDGITVTISR